MPTAPRCSARPLAHRNAHLTARPADRARLRPTRRLLAALAVALLVAGCTSSDDGDAGDGSSPSGDDQASTTAAAAPRPEGPIPEVEGPVTGGDYGVPYNPAPPALLEDAGYVEEEYFISGEATSYTTSGDQTADPQIEVEAGPTAGYVSRIIVRRPADAADASGTAVVEWLNVSAGRDSDPMWGILHPTITAAGDTYVAVSAQLVGIEGGGALEIPGVPEVATLPLKEWDPTRYGALDHPGDDFSYDIFAQVGRLLRGETPVMGDTVAGRVVGLGESQSASRLVTYANALLPDDEVYDALVIVGRQGGTAPLSEDGDPAPSGEGVLLRTDLDQPILVVQSETDLTFFGSLVSRQPDTDRIVTWEVAGAAHADTGFIDYGRDSGRVWAPDADVSFDELCGGPLNDGSLTEVVRAGYVTLPTWLTDGTPPPSADPLEVEGEDIARDDLGIALGGVRTPSVEAPRSVLSGEPRPGSSVFCSLFGSTEPLPAGVAADLYPTAEAYLDAVTEAADAAVDAGFLLPEDRDAIVAEAAEQGPPTD